MPRSIPSGLLLSVLAALALSTGCTTTVAGTPSSAGAGAGAPAAGDPVAWVDQVCGALLPVIRTGANPPQLDRAVDPAELVGTLSEYLGEAEASADSAITGMAQVGPSPVAGGDEIVTELSGALTTFRTSFQEARTQLDAIDTSDPDALATGLPAAIAPLQELATLPDPTADLQNTAELDRASREAPNCQEIENLLPS
ncbi:hypothetical protein [Pseudonocardia nigra]|uniref:hypothetical protein n=1 Tax=Pseudonocardia nigra TaxID=1921578 RepID=UPI001C6048EA|nr:hypothetical protein [Pseudonocardia nigra]